jgi:predicted GIY-YIG superfamily endonuclease
VGPHPAALSTLTAHPAALRGMWICSPNKSSFDRGTGVRGVHLIHLDERVFGGQHYCGYSGKLDQRLHQHLDGLGSHYTRAAHRRGIAMYVVRVWPEAGKDVEWRIKHTGNGPVAFCPRCRSRPLDP